MQKMPFLTGWQSSLIMQAQKTSILWFFSHNLSKYCHVEDLTPVINDVEKLQEETDKWLPYFPGANPCFQGGDIYTSVLIG